MLSTKVSTLPIDTKAALMLCRSLVKWGGQEARNSHHQNLSVSKKTDKSLVSQVDKQIEDQLVKKIHEKFPDHAIYGEETGGSFHTTQPTWIIDPIEGTTNYIHGLPLFGTQIALMHLGKIYCAAVYDPNSKTLISAALNQGAKINDKPLSLSSQPLNEVTLLIDSGRNAELSSKFFHSNIISHFRSYRRLGSLVADLIFMSQHAASAFVGFTGQLYDFAPAALILSEIGYVIVDDSLERWRPANPVSLFAFHPELKNVVIPLLQKLY